MTKEDGWDVVAQGAWFDVVRRLRVPAKYGKFKLALMVLGTYADTDGGSVRPGAARLALDVEVSYRTALRYLKLARDLGLLMRSRIGRAKDDADEYRLAFLPDVGQRLRAAGIDWITSDEYRRRATEMREGVRDGRMRQRARAVRDTHDVTYGEGVRDIQDDTYDPWRT